jgi:hypothetical protein
MPLIHKADSYHSHFARLRLAVTSACGFERQPIANPDFVRINSSGLQLADVQKHIGSAAVDSNKSEAAVGIPHFQFAGAHLFPFRLDRGLRRRSCQPLGLQPRPVFMEGFLGPFVIRNRFLGLNLPGCVSDLTLGVSERFSFVCL